MSDPPSPAYCLSLFDQYHMLPNIRAHSLKVRDVSLVIAEAVEKAGTPIDAPLVEAGAMLHDITKTRSIETKENHAQTGEALLIELGFPRTGQVVGEHIIPRYRGDELTAAEIVAYADKRVLHDRVVELEVRFGYLLERYGHFPNALVYYEKMRERMSHIERVVEEIINIPFETLALTA